MKTSIGLGWASILLAFPLLGQPPDLPALKQRLNEYLTLQQRQMGFNGVLLVARHDTILYEESVGLASLELGVALNKQSAFKIASISKTFTARLVAMAQEEGLLRFDDKLSKYLPDVPASFQAITLHQLLCHTSGLPHHEGIPDYWPVKSKLPLTPEQIQQEIFNLNLLFAPGTQMHYSSLGYYLLAVIVEKVYKQPFQRLLDGKILKPLDMKATGIVNNQAVIQQMASGYLKVAEDCLVMAPYRDYAILKGAGDLYSTAQDLFKWSKMMLSANHLRADTKARVFAPNLPVGNKENSRYGYGWYIKQPGAAPLAYHHGGGTWGYSSYLAIYPQEQLCIILLCNVFPLPTESIWQDVEKIVFKLPFEMPQLERAVAIPQEALPPYVGNYVSQPGGRQMSIRLHQDKLFAQLTGNPAFELFYRGQHTFFGKTIDAVFSFSMDEDGKPAGLRVRRRGQEFDFKKR